MAIAEIFKRVGDYVMDSFRGDDEVFDELNSDEYYYGEEVEPGTSAVRAVDYNVMNERKQEQKVIRPSKFNQQQRGNEIVVLEAHSFDDSATIVQHLKENKIVTLDLHLLENHQSQRVIDFVCGASQALDAQPKKIADKVFVFAPHNVTLSADLPVAQDKFSDSLWRTSLQ